MKKIFTILILLLSVSSSLFGQDGNKVAVSIYSLDYADEHKTVFLTHKKKDVHEIRLSSANVLGPFETTLNDESKVSIRSKVILEDGEVSYPPLVSVKIPSGMKQPLLVLVPVVGSVPYKAIIIDRSMQEFPKGSYKLINFSASDIRARIGKTQLVAPSKKITSFDPSKNSQKLLDVHFQYMNQNAWKTFGRTRWINEKEKRSILCAFFDPKTRRMKIRGLVVKPIVSTKK